MRVPPFDGNGAPLDPAELSKLTEKASLGGSLHSGAQSMPIRAILRTD